MRTGNPNNAPYRHEEGSEVNMRVLVVGSSGGIGSAFVSLLGKDLRVTHVIGWSRKAQEDSERFSVSVVDVRDEHTIQEAARDLGEIDRVIVATGVLHNQQTLSPEKTWRSLDATTMSEVFAINTIGPALVAKHVLGLLPKDRPSVFAALSARVGSISDNKLGGWYSYRASKAALNQIIRCAAIELATRWPQAICVALHPGSVDTALSRPFQSGVPHSKLFSTQQAASQLWSVMDSLEPRHSGQLMDWQGQEIEP
jgi:NAD(P)-dependent dehydrogenase (short-subunit alcohol dehydrogenase family)